jgi:hypothetical protein
LLLTPAVVINTCKNISQASFAGIVLDRQEEISKLKSSLHLKYDNFATFSSFELSLREPYMMQY